MSPSPADNPSQAAPRSAGGRESLRRPVTPLRPIVYRSIYGAAILVSIAGCFLLIRSRVFDTHTTAIVGALAAMLPIAAAAVLIGRLEDLHCRRLMRRGLGQECACGYDLHGSEDFREPRCPECGRTLSTSRTSNRAQTE